MSKPHLEAKVRTILCLIFLALLLAWPTLAAAQDSYKLAVVVEANDFMNQTWQESSRGESLLKNLLMYLNTVPVQIDLQVWWVAENTLIYDKSTWPKPSQRDQLPVFAGNSSPAPALAQALTWLQPGGTLLFIGVEAPTLDENTLQLLKQDQIFCHVLALQPKESSPLVALALAGGGGYFEAEAPGRVGPFTGTALRSAVSEGRLKIITHSPNNQRLDLTVTLERNDTLEASRAVACWRMLQIAPGNYRVIWPNNNEMPGPAELPQRLSVDKNAGPELNVGGTGSISLRSHNGSGSEQHWPLVVLDATTGKLWENKREAPFTLSLPASIYRVYSVSPMRQEWRASLAAGQNLEHTFGPKASILIEVPGPGKSWQVPFRLNSDQYQPTLRGQSGVKMQINPGNYLLNVETIPQILQEISINPEQNLEIKIAAQGAVLARRSQGAPRGFAIQDFNGATLGRGGENRHVLLAPGQYWLMWDNNTNRLPVTIEPDQVYVVQEPSRPSND